MAIPGVAVLGETTTGVAGVVVGDATAQRMSQIHAGTAHLEAVAIARFPIVTPITIGLATAEGDRCSGLPEIKAVIRIVVGVAGDEFIARTGAEFAGVTVGVSATGIGVVIALAILDGIVVGTAALDLNTGIVVAVGITRVDDAPGFSINVNTRMIHLRHCDLVEPDVVARNETVARTIEIERGRAGDGDTGRNIALTADAVGTRHIDRLSGLGSLDGVNDIGAGHQTTHHDGGSY